MNLSMLIQRKEFKDKHHIMKTKKIVNYIRMLNTKLKQPDKATTTTIKQNSLFQLQLVDQNQLPLKKLTNIL